MPDIGELTAAVLEAFSSATRPERFTAGITPNLEWSDDEIDRAEAVFASRDPETLQATDVGIGAGWPEVFLTKTALHYYMRGFVRLVLENASDDGFSHDDFLSILAPEKIGALNQGQKAAIAAALEFVRDRLGERGKELVDRRLKRLRA